MGPLFITFEGIDGAGKTSQLQAAAWFLRKEKRRVRVFREPGGTQLGEHIRELLLHGQEMTAKAEASLFAAARAELVERAIKPALAEGFDVICDRYVESSLAYQVYGRGLDFDAVAAWNAYVVDDLAPTRTYLLSIAAEDVARGRQLSLFEDEADELSSPDRLERESLIFQRRVELGYDALASRFSQRILRVSAYLKPPQIKSIIRHDLSLLVSSTGHQALV